MTNHICATEVPPGSPPPVMPPSPETPDEIVELPPSEPTQPIREPGKVIPTQALA